MPPIDPVAAFAALFPLALTTIDQVEQLIERLKDHGRTLSSSISDGDAADAKLDADVNPTAAPQP